MGKHTTMSGNGYNREEEDRKPHVEWPPPTTAMLTERAERAAFYKAACDRAYREEMKKHLLPATKEGCLRIAKDLRELGEDDEALRYEEAAAQL
jgi:hypothetical protein